VKEPGELEVTFASMKTQEVDAVIVSPDLMLASNASQVSDLAIKYGLAIIAWDSRMTETGFLMSYGSKPAEMERRLAFYVNRILAGISSRRLPTEMPSNLSLAINLRTADRMKINLPRSLLIMADQVVE
jgi:putative ABC transport system substrate-binding protein